MIEGIELVPMHGYRREKTLEVLLYLQLKRQKHIPMASSISDSWLSINALVNVEGKVSAVRCNKLSPRSKLLYYQPHFTLLTSCDVKKRPLTLPATTTLCSSRRKRDGANFMRGHHYEIISIIPEDGVAHHHGRGPLELSWVNIIKRR